MILREERVRVFKPFLKEATPAVAKRKWQLVRSEPGPSYMEEPP